MTDTNKGIVYDAPEVGRILGLPTNCSDPVPKAEDGEIVVYYGGWGLKQLSLSPGGKKRMYQDVNWFDWMAEPGYYRLLLPVPNSNSKTWTQQLDQLKSIDNAWQPASIAVAATALLVHLTETGEDLLDEDWCRCADMLLGSEGEHVLLTVSSDRVDGYDCDSDDEDDDVWLAAARKC